MPELPEVETARRMMDQALAGHTVQKVTVTRDPLVYENLPSSHIRSALQGARVLGSGRRGKYFWLELDRRPWPLFHLGMTGAIHVYATAAERPDYCKLEMVIAEGTRLALTTTRRLARVRLRHQPEDEPPLDRLGRDPLTDPMSWHELMACFQGRRAPVKSLLLNQTLFPGVGNWIADEVLYQARIAPQRPAGSLPAEACRALCRCLTRILRKAVDVQADAAHFPRTWLFHHRWGRRPNQRTQKGELLAFDTIGGRTTAWVPERQT